MSSVKVSYVKTCPVCNEQFVTYDSRVITDKEACCTELKKKNARERYHRHISGEEDAPNWRQSSSRTVRLVCAEILKALPASRRRLEHVLADLVKRKKLVGPITESTLPNCLTRLRVAKHAAYDQEHEIWVRTRQPHDFKETIER